VGKTSLIRRFVHNQFDEKYLSTVGTNISSKDVEVYIPDKGTNLGLKLLIWDIAGQLMFSDVDATYFKGAKGALVVCDITDRSTLDNLPDWIYRFRSICPDAPFMILVNKSDLSNQRQLEPEDAGRIANGYKTHFFLTSAKTGDGVENAFHTLGVAIGHIQMGIKTPAGGRQQVQKVELYERLEDRKQ
jgi:small GTP-binding protein